MDLIQLSKIAIKAALSAGKIIQQYKNENISVEVKKGGESYASQVVTVVDKACETAILSYLLPTCEEFDIALLSEETEDDASRFEKEFFWCIDPMDGTLAFINKHPGFSVAIALIAKDGTPYIGVVFDPSTDTLYHAIKGHGAFKNNIPWEIKHTNDHLTYVTDQKLKDTPRVTEIESLLNTNVAELNLNGVKEIAGAGSILNAILVLENGPACMLKFPKKESGGGSIWDFAATACIYQELGLPATNFEGGKLDLNKKEGTFMNHAGVYYGNLMSNRILPATGSNDQKRLREQIQTCQEELEKIQQETRTFEALLYAQLSDLIVEEQELFILYKQIKKAKKAKRLAQKKRGKNYKENTGLQITAKQKKKDIPSDQQQEKKRLYREAILHIHPDKFSMNENETDIATEMTSRLIEIYKTGSLETLQAYHAHIFNGNAGIQLEDAAASIKVIHKDDYLQQEKDSIEKAIHLAKNHQLYKVITEYEDPLLFIKELKAYYEDRILKLKKRTRKGL